MTGREGLRSQGRLRALLVLAGFAVLVPSIAIYRSANVEKPWLGPGFAPAAGAPQAVPDLRFQDGKGNLLSLSEFRGKFVLLNVWATWCAPCREEMPALDRLQQQLGGPDFEVAALSIDRGGAVAVRAFYEEMDIRALSIYVDPGSEAMSTLRTVGIPTTLLVDREGRELWRKTGAATWDNGDFVEHLRRQMRGSAS